MTYCGNHRGSSERWAWALHGRGRCIDKYVPAGFALVMGLAALGALPVHCGLLVHAGWLGGSLLYDGMHFSFHHGPDIKFSWYHLHVIST